MPAAVEASNRSHSVASVRPRPGAHLVDLLGQQQGGVVARVARDRQPPALHRVGEDHAGPVPDLIAGGVGGQHAGQVVPTQVGDQRGQLVVGHAGQGLVHAGRGAVVEPLPQLLTGQAEQRLVVLVGHVVDPGPQRAAVGLGELGLELAPVLGLGHVPAGRLELAPPVRGADAGHHPVQRLPVEVDHPHHVAQPVRGRVEDGFPDVALVQFGVAQQGDEPGPGPVAEVRVHVPAGHRGEQGRDRAETDRPGREVDFVRVLGPGRVGLQATAGAQRGQVLPVQVAQQVLDGVEHRGRVRLHADPVLGGQVGEVQRGHRGDQRGTGGLVAADLDPVPGGPLAVGRVHHPHRQPQHPALDLIQHVQIHGGAAGHGGGLRQDQVTHAALAQGPRTVTPSTGR